MSKKKKLSCDQINYYIKDEAKASKEYRKLGLKKLASDETKHRKFFEKQKRKCKS